MPSAASVEKSADPVQDEINKAKRERASLIDQMRRLKGRLDYKEAERGAIQKLAAYDRPNNNLGRLRKMKKNIEFQISTQAGTLAAEKVLIKKLTDIDAELEEALKSFRMKRKLEFLASDIESLNRELEAHKDKVIELDKKLDVLFAGIRGRVARQRRSESGQPRPQKRSEPFEISLEDIATIKKKEQK